jgi:hypothetical protein
VEEEAGPSLGVAGRQQNTQPLEVQPDQLRAAQAAEEIFQENEERLDRGGARTT